MKKYRLPKPFTNNVINLLRDLQKQVNDLPAKINSLPIQVSSVISLKEDELKQIEIILTEKLQKPVVIKNIIQKEIIAGLKIIIGSKIIDLSYATQLDQLHHKIKQFNL